MEISACVLDVFSYAASSKVQRTHASGSYQSAPNVQGAGSQKWYSGIPTSLKPCLNSYFCETLPVHFGWYVFVSSSWRSQARRKRLKNGKSCRKLKVMTFLDRVRGRLKVGNLAGSWSFFMGDRFRVRSLRRVLSILCRCVCYSPCLCSHSCVRIDSAIEGLVVVRIENPCSCGKLVKLLPLAKWALRHLASPQGPRFILAESFLLQKRHHTITFWPLNWWEIRDFIHPRYI